MSSPTDQFAERLTSFIARRHHGPGPALPGDDALFAGFALDLFAAQYEGVPAYRALCGSTGAVPGAVTRWQDIPAVPTAAFKELELTSIPAAERTRVFHSSGTSETRPSRHFHHGRSTALYEFSAARWFAANMLDDIPAASPEGGPEEADRPVLVALTPPPAEAHRSSLVHMLATVIGRFGSPDSVFAGRIDGSGNWDVDCDRLDRTLRRAIDAARPACLMGTAFNFVHVLDRLADGGRRYGLPAGSRAMETGGYKGRSRELSRGELHARIADRFGIVPGRVVTEYGMSELSSQAYGRGGVGLRFPPWTRVRAVSPEDGSEMPEGRPGLVRVHDLANVWSVAAVETGDLGILRDGGLELLGRAGTAAPRGCSLMTA